MLKEIRAQRALSHAHFGWNGVAFSQLDAVSAEVLSSFFRPRQILYRDNEILVTDVGFVVMAIYTDKATRIDDAFIVPGIDSTGIRGNIVLCKEKLPYHSLCREPTEAYEDAANSLLKAAALLSYFGSRSAMQEAVAKTPWYSVSTLEDYDQTGLCQWGKNAFLQKYGLQRMARRVGLPKCLLQIAGVYGERVIAASIVRREQGDRAKQSGDRVQSL